MGGIVPFPCLNSLDGFNLIFPCAFLSNTCIEMKRDLNLRTSFVNYIKDAEWMDNLIENDNKSLTPDNILLNRYSFFVNISPKDVNTPKIKKLQSDVSESDFTNDMTQPTESEIEGSSFIMKIFSNKTDCRSILLSIMYLLYSKSISISKLSTIAEEFLFHAATMFDSDDLLAYLADPHSSFVNELYQGFQKLPFHVLISSNNSSNSTGRNSNNSAIIIYSNRDNTFCGQNLYEDYIPNRLINNHNTTTTTTNNITNNITTTNTNNIKKNDDYRVVLVENTNVSLFAHVQLYNSDNMSMYTIFLESNNFDLCMNTKQHSSRFLEHANQMEVLLSLLYVLIDY